MKFDLECKKHPKYKAKRYPISGCEACKILYWLRRDGCRNLLDDLPRPVVKKPAKNHDTPGTLN